MSWIQVYPMCKDWGNPRTDLMACGVRRGQFPLPIRNFHAGRMLAKRCLRGKREYGVCKARNCRPSSKEPKILIYMVYYGPHFTLTPSCEVK